MASHSIACPDFLHWNISPDLDRTAMAILRSRHKTGKKNRKLNGSRNWLAESANTRDANKCANARFAFYFDAFHMYFILKSRVYSLGMIIDYRVRGEEIFAIFFELISSISG
jgi:hypothetical protein